MIDTQIIFRVQIITNSPFSLFREYVAVLMEHEKKFLIIGNMNAITYKEFFPLLKDDEVWIGCTNVKEFLQSDGSIKKFGNIGWFTNLDIEKRHEKLILWKKYTPEEYPKYDNYDAINVDKVSEIPCDYDGVMGVPITFTNGSKANTRATLLVDAAASTYYTADNSDGKLVIVYARILIRKKVRA